MLGLAVFFAVFGSINLDDPRLWWHVVLMVAVLILPVGFIRLLQNGREPAPHPH